MKHTEYIIPIGEDAQDYDEIFIGVIRRHPELVRCKDCVDCKTAEFGHGRFWKYCETIGSTVNDDDYCCWAERRKENG